MRKNRAANGEIGSEELFSTAGLAKRYTSKRRAKVEDGYAVAIAVEGRGLHIRCWMTG